tara:strand:+ start:248 stop:496 length:249 start_codon:yes stop_codon:yes gene_type:complete
MSLRVQVLKEMAVQMEHSGSWSLWSIMTAFPASRALQVRELVLDICNVKEDRKPDWAYNGSREARERDELNERREYFRRFGL